MNYDNLTYPFEFTLDDWRDFPMTSSIDAAPPDFLRRVHRALKCWHNRRPQEGLLDDLLIAQRMAGGELTERRLITNLLLKQGIGQLALLSPLDAELLDLRFCTCQHVRETREQINYAESTLYHKQNLAIAHLAAVLHQLETAAWDERIASLEGRLDAPPCNLIGVEGQVIQLCRLLASSPGPWLVSIEGMGGVGKTALAAAVLRRLARTMAYEGFGWVSAQITTLDLCGKLHPCLHPTITSTAILAALVRQLLPEVHPALAGSSEALSALRLHLRRYPHLIVIDHWDTVLDPQVLLPLLHSLANPSKFVLTSRRRLIAEPYVHLHCVPELSRADSLLLMRRMAQAHELTPLIACDDEDLALVYAAVGGNPQALMFVLDQTHVRSLQQVLVELAHFGDGPVETLFGFILHQTWLGLSEQEHRLLKIMPAAELRCLDAEGIGELGQLGMAETANALQRLIQAGLVSAAVELDGCRYLLHNLTRSYLRRLARRWGEKNAEQSGSPCPAFLPAVDR